MKYIIFVVFILCIQLVSSQVKRVDISMTRADFESLYQRRLDSKKYLPVTLTVDGKTYKDANIRFKGKTSLLMPKKPFKIKFEKDASPPQIFNGVRIMDFNAMYTDKSFMREKLVWEIFSMMGGFGPKEFGYANLYINGVDNGINLMLQHIDKDFFRVNGKTLGEYYEAQFDDLPGNLGVLSDADMKRAYENENENENDYTSLKELIAQLNNASDAEFANTMNNLFDMKTVYDWLILNTITMDGDTYAKNYYLYKDPDKQTQQWSVIPWDYDLSFGREGDVRQQYPNSILNDDFAYNYDPFDGTPNVIRDRISKDYTLKEEYKRRLKDVLDNIFTEEKLFPIIDELGKELDEYIKKEPVRWGTYDEFKDQTEILKYFISARRNYLFSLFFNQRASENDEATLDVSQAGLAYNFTDHDGRQVAALTFGSISGLQKVTVHSFPSSTPSGFSSDKCINRYIEIIPYPANASFTAELKWEYENMPELTEIGTGIHDTHALESFTYKNGSWRAIGSYLNSYGNVVTIPGISESDCGAGKYFALRMPEDIDLNWKKQNNLFWQRWNDAQISPGGNIFVVGDDGTMLKSQDGGSSWKEQYMGVHQSFRSVAAVNNELLFACGMYGFLLKSIDGGHGWKFLKSGLTNNINCIIFKDEKNGFAASDDKTIIITHNGGDSWSSVHLSAAGNINSLLLAGNDDIIAGDNDGSVFISKDEGKSWKSVNSQTKSGINRFMRKDEHEIFGVCVKGAIIHSTDDGASWSVKQLNSDDDLYAITLADNSDIYVAGENGVMFYSPDGSNWTMNRIEYGYDLQAMAYSGSNSGLIAVGNWGTILHSH